MTIQKVAARLYLFVALLSLLLCSCSANHEEYGEWSGFYGGRFLHGEIRCTNTTLNGVEYKYDVAINIGGGDPIFMDGHVNFGDGSATKTFSSVNTNTSIINNGYNEVVGKILHIYAGDGLYEITANATAGVIVNNTRRPVMRKSVVFKPVRIEGDKCRIVYDDDDDESEATSIRQITKTLWLLAAGLLLFFLSS